MQQINQAPDLTAYFHKRFREGLLYHFGKDEGGKIYQDVCDDKYRYAGGNQDLKGGRQHLRYRETYFKNLPTQPNEERCICGVRIQNQCYLIKRSTEKALQPEFLYPLGVCCIEQFCEQGIAQECSECGHEKPFCMWVSDGLVCRDCQKNATVMRNRELKAALRQTNIARRTCAECKRFDRAYDHTVTAEDGRQLCQLCGDALKRQAAHEAAAAEAAQKLRDALKRQAAHEAAAAEAAQKLRDETAAAAQKLRDEAAAAAKEKRMWSEAKQQEQARRDGCVDIRDAFRRCLTKA